MKRPGDVVFGAVLSRSYPAAYVVSRATVKAWGKQVLLNERTQGFSFGVRVAPEACFETAEEALNAARKRTFDAAAELEAQARELREMATNYPMVLRDAFEL